MIKVTNLLWVDRNSGTFDGQMLRIRDVAYKQLHPLNVN